MPTDKQLDLFSSALAAASVLLDAGAIHAAYDVMCAYDAATRSAEALSWDLTFRAFRKHNANRCEEAFHIIDRNTDLEWAALIAGEAGEVIKVINKHRQGALTDDAACLEIGKELSDVITYCDLLAEKLGIDLGAAIVQKFNEVNARKGRSDLDIPINPNDAETGSHLQMVEGAGSEASLDEMRVVLAQRDRGLLTKEELAYKLNAIRSRMALGPIPEEQFPGPEGLIRTPRTTPPRKPQ